ncbi:aminotransferase class I/II-fold pyridoxal phosphate-dependent enzyme [Brevibacillus sp. SKDU10]|uniref:aminotransferase class I/II-fold pyridoxal phosphate-dependent enzyme n=1 Tax=Brevibacillus sp. SKDU10 TaxID=1247872 RepID=UPI000A9D8F5E|nr:aminotransferase class I/II-fold pyridoxal phosphate-dependent enzyme [Brevibacillus sp. SKDU10]
MAAKQWLQRFNLDVNVENISITSGGQNSFTLILITLFQPDDKIAVDSYAYPNFIELANMLNIQLIPVAGDALGMLPDQLDFATPLKYAIRKLVHRYKGRNSKKSIIRSIQEIDFLLFYDLLNVFFKILAVPLFYV